MYRYEDFRAGVFTEEGQRMFLEIRDRAQRLLRAAGAFQMQKVLEGSGGDSWQMLACVDRLAELGEVLEVSPGLAHCTQHRVFVATGAWVDLTR